MLRCVVLYNDSTDCNITLLRDNNVIVNCMGNYILDSFLQSTGVDCLQVIYKPSIPRTVPENGFKIGSIAVNGLIKPCVISTEEIKRLADYSSLYGIKEIMIYNYIDLIVDRYKTEDSVIVLSEWVADYGVIAYIEFGKLIEFRRVKESKLTSSLSKMRSRFRCNNVVQFDNSFDFANCYSTISNMKLVDKDKQIFLSHIPYVVDNTGISLFENNVISSIPLMSLDVEDDSEDSIYSRDNDETAYEVDTEVDTEVEEHLDEEPPVEVGFFGRLFGKGSSKKSKDDKTLSKNISPKEPVQSSKKSKSERSRKEKGFNFEEYTETSEEEDDEQYFSNLANGSTKPSYNSFGANPSMKRKFGFFDYAFYTVFVIFFTCSVVVGGLQLVYKEKLRVLAGEYDSAIKVKNQLETNVSLSFDNSKSPATKVTQIISLNIPKTFSIRNVDYDGTQYKVNIEVEKDDNIDVIRDYLPSDLVVTNISLLSNADGSASTKKIYEVVLLIS